MIKNLMKMGWPILLMVFFAIILLQERGGVPYNKTIEERNPILPIEKLVFSPKVIGKKDCLLIYSSENAVSQLYKKDMGFILDGMRVPYETVDLHKGKLPNLRDYKTVVLACSDLSCLGDNVLDLFSWVYEGGSFMNTNTYDLNNYFNVVARKMGILEVGNYYSGIEGFRVKNDFMIGGQREIIYDEPLETSLQIQLHQDCRVYLESVKTNLPLLWETSYGNGKVVTINQTIVDKTNRGYLSAAYSLLEDICVYPVINGSAFYIDDFPAPVPGGNSEYINLEYNRSVSDFYMDIWWPDILEWQKKYQLRHTGLIIEVYSDHVQAPFPSQKEKERFVYFGNNLLNKGGELGWHGYNHMPLCFDNFDYKGLFDGYNPWESKGDIVSSLLELQRFSSALFPKEKISVYVPPSNILSKEGRRILKEEFHNIQVIASTYLEGNCELSQEFGRGEDGIVNTPRITYGCIIDEYSKNMAFSELNFHYVQSHFMHPDDVLDKDRGAELGWKKMKENFSKYLDYIYTSVPNIRNVTGSQMGSAVAQYDALSMKREVQGNKMKITLGGFSNEAYFMMRTNGLEIKAIEGATYEHIVGNLYLIHGEKDEIEITWEESL